MWLRWMVWPASSLMARDSSDSDGQRAVDDQVGPRDAARRRARQEHDRVRHFVRGAELAGWIRLQRRSEQVRHVFLDRLPNAAVEVGVARGHAVDADALVDELPAQALGV